MWVSPGANSGGAMLAVINLPLMGESLAIDADEGTERNLVRFLLPIWFSFVVIGLTGLLPRSAYELCIRLRTKLKVKLETYECGHYCMCVAM